MRIKLNALTGVVTWLVVFGLIPISLSALTSFLTPDPIHWVSLPFTLTNYLALLNPVIGNVMVRTLLLAGCATLACLILAYPFSFLMVKSKFQSLLLLLIIIPFWTSSLIRTYALIAILKLHGVLNSILLSGHFITKPLTLLYTNTSVVIGLIYTLFPFMVLPLFTAMQRFDFRLFEAARDLGATPWTLFFNVFLPNTKQGIISGCLLVFLPAMTLFYIPNVLGGAHSVLLGNLIQNQFFVEENWPAGCATSLLLTGALVATLMLSRKS